MTELTFNDEPYFPGARVPDMTVTSANYDGPWYHHPARPCKGREEFADLMLVRERAGSSHRETKAREIFNAAVDGMVRECLSCPVLRQCRTDYLATNKHHDFWGIRAGIVGRSA